MIRFVRWVLRLLYGFWADNEPVLKTAGPVLLLPNHVSWWDWLFIGACLDPDWRFVTSSTAAETSWLHKLIMVNRRTFPVDMNSPYAVKHMADYLHKGGRLVLFPEGRISTSGTLMKLYDGTGFLIRKTGAKVITAYIRNAERLPFSRNPNQKKIFPRVSAHFSAVLAPPPIDHQTAAHARAQLTDWLRDRMLEQQVATEMRFGARTLLEAFDGAARLQPGRKILQDSSMATLTYRRMLIGSRLLAGAWRNLLGTGEREETPASDAEPPANAEAATESAARSREEQHVGVLLPNVNAAPVVMLSLWQAGLVPAILNYTSGPATMLSCSRVAGLKTVITSRAFVTGGRLDLAALENAGIRIVYLEDVRSQISPGRKLLETLRQWIMPGLICSTAKAGDTALILFTSGSEGEPKAVALSHSNLLANIRQVVSIIDLVETDRFFTALPLFHSFGMSIGLWLPLVRNVFVFLYLSPLHYRVVPAAIYNLNSTVMFGTNTFLSGYARKAHAYDFHTLRYVFAGAEKLQESTATIWMQKFGVRVLEGYGATECSPVVAVNVPMNPRAGWAGRLLPGVDYRLEPVEGVSGSDPQVGRLLVRGPNIMRGYLNPQPNAKFLALNGWYDTGDIVRVDEHRFVQVLGRLKRFAKISGEMVSLGAVEDALARLNHFGPKFAVAVIAQRDESKGEKLVAVTNEPRLTLAEVREAVRAAGLGNLAMPRELRTVREMPLLATGKVDYRRLSESLND